MVKFIPVGLLLLTFSCKNNDLVPVEISGHQVDSGGVTLWYNQPSSVYFNDKYKRTYFAYLNKSNELVLRYYDFELKAISFPRIVDSWDSADDHGAPVLWVKRLKPNKGKLIMFYSHHSSPMYYKVSTHPESIDFWSERKLLDEGSCTYGSIVEDMSGKLNIFYTVQTDRRVLVRRESNDGGVTWSDPFKIIDFGVGTFIYAAPVAIEGNRMAIAWTVYRKEGDQKGHKDIFLSFSDNGINWQMSSLTTQLITLENAVPLVKTLNNRENVVWDVGFDERSMPVVIYIEHAPFVSNIGWENCYTHYLSYNHLNKNWVDEKVTPMDSNIYPAGAILNPENHKNILVGGNNSLSSWLKMPDDRWHLLEVVLNADTSTYFNPVIPYGSIQHRELFWINVRSYLDKDYNASLNYFNK